MPKRGAALSVVVSAAKRQTTDNFEAWAAIVFNWLVVKDIVNFICVCRQWHRFVVEQIEQWCETLSMHPDMIRGTHPILKFRPCLHQLYMAQDYKWITYESYMKLKDRLGFTDKYLFNGSGEIFIVTSTELRSTWVRNYEEYAKDDSLALEHPNFQEGFYEDILGIARCAGVTDDWIPNSELTSEIVQALLNASEKLRWTIVATLIVEKLKLDLTALLTTQTPLELVTYLMRYWPLVLDWSFYKWATPRPQIFQSEYGSNLIKLFSFDDNGVPNTGTLLDTWLRKMIDWRLISTVYPLFIMLFQERKAIQLFCKHYKRGLALGELSELVDAIPKDYFGEFILVHDKLLKVLRRKGHLSHNYWKGFFVWFWDQEENFLNPHATLIKYMVKDREFFTALFSALSEHPYLVSRYTRRIFYSVGEVALYFFGSHGECSIETLIENLNPLIGKLQADALAAKIIRRFIGRDSYSVFAKVVPEDRSTWLRQHFLAKHFLK